jgi:hypothetical protein
MRTGTRQRYYEQKYTLPDEFPEQDAAIFAPNVGFLHGSGCVKKIETHIGMIRC